MKVVDANLDHWRSIRVLLEKITTGDGIYERARKVIDCEPRSIESYLVRSLVESKFHMWLILDEFENVRAFCVMLESVNLDFKNPKKGPTRCGFVITIFSDNNEATELLVKKLRAFGKAEGLIYYHGNVKIDGAHKHFLEHYGGKEISRCIYVETEALHG